MSGRRSFRIGGAPRRDVDDELAFHFESRVEDLVALGASPEEARRQADTEFGDVAAVRHELVTATRRRAARRSRVELLFDLAADVRYCLRSLRNNAGVAATVILTLALGVGANAAMFSFLETVFVKPPAGVVAPREVRRVWARRDYADGVHYSTVMSYGQYEVVRDALADRSAVTVYRVPGATRLSDGHTTSQVRASYAPRSFFSVLGARPLFGRFFSAEEDALTAQTPVAVVSEPFWRRELGEDPAVLGRAVRLSGRTYTIIGVSGGGFSGADLDATDVWLPLSAYGKPGSNPPWWKNWRINGLQILVRPRAGVEASEIEQRITVALRQVQLGPYRDSTTVATLGSIVAANGPGAKSPEEQIAIRLAGVALIVLLIACANIVNLLLSRGVQRRREIAVRLALGISRARLVRLLLVETSLLSLGATVVAVGVATLGGKLLRTLLMPEVHWAEPAVDGAVLLFALVLALASGFAAGLIPTLQSRSIQLTDAMKTSGTVGRVPHATLRSLLVAGEAALSVVLLIGAALFVRSLASVEHIDVGYDRHRIVTAGVQFEDASRERDPSMPARIHDLAARIAQIGGVERVALTNIEPFAGFSWTSFYSDRDSLGSRKGWMPTVSAVTPDFFAATGLRLLRGSVFGDRGVVVNEEMARGLWPNENPIGKCIRFGSRAAACDDVTGVVENARVNRVLEEPQPAYYLPIDHLPAGVEFSANNVVVRVDPARQALVEGEVRAAILREFPGGIPSIKAMDARLEPQYRPWRLGASLFSAFGLLALVVALVGVYSTVAYSVDHRLHEFGVRMALGATLRNVIALVLMQGLRVVATGIAVGVVVAVIAGRLIAGLLYGITPGDPETLAFVSFVLLAVAAIATFVPAWRAARVDPASTLRSD